jgi:hypothetical protein
MARDSLSHGNCDCKRSACVAGKVDHDQGSALDVLGSLGNVIEGG